MGSGREKGDLGGQKKLRSDWWLLLPMTHLSINVWSGIEFEFPKLKFVDRFIIIVWCDNGSPLSNCYTIHFASGKKWMKLQMQMRNQLVPYPMNAKLLSITVFCSCDTFINVRKSWTPTNISATSLARSISNPLFLWNQLNSIIATANRGRAMLNLTYNKKWHRRYSSIGTNKL